MDMRDEKRVARFGGFFKAKRIELDLTLRKFASINKLDPGNLSKIERGVLPPPQSREKLEEYAKFLNLKPGTDDWYTFFDLAAAESGRIPEELLSNSEILDSLPLFFRTMRGQKVSDENLEKLIQLIKKH